MKVLGFGSLVGLACCLLPGSVSAQAEQPTVDVVGYQVRGNTLLGGAVLDAVLLPLKGRRTLDELHRAAAAVQALYAQAGYGAVVAYVPPQTPSDGVVTISVVEGKLRAVTVKGAEQFPAANIVASLPDLAVGATPRLRDIDAQLRIANENPAKQVQVLLRPGRQTGDVEAELAVTEQPLRRWTVGLDNTGNARTGEFRVSLGWQHANLSGHDDVFNAQAQTSPTEPDKVAVLSGGYRWPLYRQHMVLDAFAALSDVDGGSSQTLAGDLRFNGRGRIFGARAAWYLPRWGDFDQRVAVGLDRRDYLNRCEIEGLPVGACGPAGSSVSVTPLSLEYTVQSAGVMLIGAGASIHHNLRTGGSRSGAEAFEAVRTGATPGYTAVRFGAQVGMAVLDDWQLRGRLTGQLTGDALVSGEQFGLGGMSSIRGYDERELVGDSGAALAIEVGTPALFGDRLGEGAALRLHTFADLGHAQNNRGAPCLEARTHCTLASLGLGARFGRGPLQARLDLAYPLNDAARTRRGDARAHVAVQYGF